MELEHELVPDGHDVQASAITLALVILGGHDGSHDRRHRPAHGRTCPRLFRHDRTCHDLARFRVFEVERVQLFSVFFGVPRGIAPEANTEAGAPRSSIWSLERPSLVSPRQCEEGC